MNQLANETSPYLLQHKDNPVAWYPWGPEALTRAKTANRPIFLSIGYAACHWCHVMERESFENDGIAALLNEHFVCIKVDREERPDLDHIYMQAVQLMTGRGGWPLSVFLTPDLQPFFGGTYWPPSGRMGMPGFDQVITAVVDAWANRRDVAVQQAARLTDALRGNGTPSEGVVSADLLTAAAMRLDRAFDTVDGGFGSAPKFPRPVELQMLLRTWRRDGRQRSLEMVQLTLDKMAYGGIYDHLAGGFARYSVDSHWLVPHFEKMLYDNALLADAYLDGYLAAGNPLYAQVAGETIDYVLEYMTDPSGGFYSTEDADSEGEEGRFYVWSEQEILALLGSEAGRRFCVAYGVTPEGNFEGKNILHLPRSVEQSASMLHCDVATLRDELAEARDQLLAARAQRVRPARDDKVLTSWNGMMINSLARAAGILDRPDYLAAAQLAANFVLTELRRPDNRLWHCWRAGQAKLDAYLDDYAYLINALVSLYESDFDERWIDEASSLSDIVLHHFADPKRGALYFTADDHEPLITRTKEQYDGSVPSSNAMAATAFIRLGKLCGRHDLIETAHDVLQAASGTMQSTPEAVAQMLVAADLAVGPTWEIAILGDPGAADTRVVLEALRKTFLPRRVVACRHPEHSSGRSALLDPLFVGKSDALPHPVVYACENFTCGEPVTGKEAILALWTALSGEQPQVH